MIVRLLATVTVMSLAFEAFAKPGFHQISDRLIPEAVKAASSGVYRLKFPILPAFDPRSEQGVEILESVTRAMANYDDFERSVIQPQLEICKANLDQLCTLYDYGSAFLIENNNTLWTAFHNGDIFLTVMSQLEGINLEDGLTDSEFEKVKTFRFPIQLIDQHGVVVFGGKDDFASFEALNPFFFQGLSVASDPNFLDHVKFKLSRPVDHGIPLHFARDASETGEEVFLLGFPRPTNDRIMIDQPDSDGRSLRVSLGRVLSYSEAYQRWGLVLESLSLPAQTITYESELHFDADCVSGNSGGPVLNSRGEVIALFNSSTPKESHLLDSNRSCLAVKSGFLQNGSRIRLRP